jgi:hypothetical protein
MNRQGIEQLQYWMKELITTQGSMEHKLQRAEQKYLLNEAEVVAETRHVSIYARMNVYTSGYVMRLMECICADFPVLQQFMGDDVFNQFAKASLLWSPSTSYSLYDLGTTFIAFLSATRPKGIAEDDPQSVYLDLPVAIAKAERARHEVIRAKGMEGTGSVALELFPDDILFYGNSIIIQTPPCIRLLESKFPLKKFFEEMQRGETYTLPEPRQTFLAISRVSYRLTDEEIEEWIFVLLKKCVAPVSLTAAIADTSSVTGMPPSALLAELCIWLPILQEKGFLVLSRN